MESIAFDEFDIKILRRLMRDGRVSIQALSEAVKLSPSPVARRLTKLENDGVIKSYSALIDETRLGFHISVFVSVKLDRQIDDALAQFEVRILELPEVTDCWLMTGNRDYLLRVVTRDMEEFEKFLVGSLTKIPSVKEIESSIPLRRVKSSIARMP